MRTYHRTGQEYHPREFPFLDDRLAVMLIESLEKAYAAVAGSTRVG